jgi:flagellar assembly factor FliW
MGRFQTAQFGEIEYEEPAVVHFPQGLPAFENETRFLLIERTETAPIVFLQSLDRERLVFLALPARLVDPAFRVELQPEERELLGIGSDPQEGEDLISLAILTVREGVAVTANLLAPIVIGARSRRALQVIQADSGYRVDQPLGAPACS